jgi:hypothetical protein
MLSLFLRLVYLGTVLVPSLPASETMCGPGDPAVRSTRAFFFVQRPNQGPNVDSVVRLLVGCSLPHMYIWQLSHAEDK